MLKLPVHTLLLVVSFLAQSSSAHLVSYHFPGYGFSWYDPLCGFACTNAISSAPLSCSSSTGSNSPQCLASSAPFLTSLAYCMNSTCDPTSVPIWKRERFWANDMTGGDATVVPILDYQAALESATKMPMTEFNSSSKSILNETVLVPQASYEEQSQFMAKFEHLEYLQPTYIFILLGVALDTPILLTLLGHSPLKKRIEKLKPYLVYPSTIRTYYVRPLPWLLGNAPTVGQALYVVVFFILNVVLSAVNYTSSQPMPWGFNRREEILAYIGYRTGHISYGLLPLLILFSGRNNFLLWITNWPFSTYLVLHRWISRIFAVQAIVHSITLLLTYKGTGSYATESKEAYWLWGIVATVLTCAMLVLSHLYFRRLSYEFFLGLHIVLAILVIIGCWYHVVLMWGYNFYLNWLYAAMAVWLFDRLARVLRMFKNGVLRSVVTELDSEFVRIDIPGVRWASKPSHVAYAYFPTLHPLRPWENHPFSINSTTLFRGNKNNTFNSRSPSSRNCSLDVDDVALDSKGLEARASAVHDAPPAPAVIGTSGVTLILKKKQGLTKLLDDNGLLTLLDGPYPQSSSSGVLECDRVLLIGGGIGITGLTAWIFAHPNVKLAWSVKRTAETLLKEMTGVTSSLEEKEIVIGDRLDLEGLLKHEADAGYERVGVVVCGPDAMCDSVRALVAGLGRSREMVFELEVDAFGW